MQAVTWVLWPPPSEDGLREWRLLDGFLRVPGPARGEVHVELGLDFMACSRPAREYVAKMVA